VKDDHENGAVTHLGIALEHAGLKREEYVNSYWRSYDSEYYCRAALRGTIATLGVANLVIGIT